MTLRMRVLPRFPAKITGTNGLTVERPAGTPDLIVKPDFGSLVQIPNVGDGDNVFFMAWDRVLSLYRIMSFNDLFDGVADLGFMEESVYDPQGKHADAFARANHTGVQAISTVTGLQAALDARPAPQAQGRLSLASGVAITESDIAGATTIYYVPATGAYAPIYDGSSMVARSIGSQLTLALDSNAAHGGYQQSGKNFDLFVFDNGGVVAFGSGPTWNAGAVAGSDVARGTGAGSTELETFNGVLVNKNTITLRFGASAGDTLSVPARRATYVGSFRATADGQASDTISKRLLFNANNVAARKIFVGVPLATTSYNYSTAAWQSLNNLGLKAELLLGLSGTLVSAKSTAQVANSTSTARIAKIGIGVDSVTPPTDGAINTAAAVPLTTVTPIAFYEGYPGIGYHYLMPVEWGGGVDTQTWFPNAGTNAGRTGMIGSVLA